MKKGTSNLIGLIVFVVILVIALSAVLPLFRQAEDILTSINSSVVNSSVNTSTLTSSNTSTSNSKSDERKDIIFWGDLIAKEGMTWYEFTTTSYGYNIDGYGNNMFFSETLCVYGGDEDYLWKDYKGRKILHSTGDNQCLAYENGDLVYSDDVIVAGYNYKFIPFEYSSSTV